MTVYRFVERERTTFPVITMCRVLGVSPSGYWAWSSRPPSARAIEDARLTARIAEIHARSRGTYGVPRVHAELRYEDNAHIGRKRVARLMRAAELEGVHRRRTTRTTVADRDAAPAPDLVNRAFTAPGPDRLWVADITYVPTWQGFLYVAVVVDAFSRRVVGWSMAGHLRTDLILDAVDMAIARRRPALGLVHHSDRGTQYTSPRSAAAAARPGSRRAWAAPGTRTTTPSAKLLREPVNALIDRSSWRARADARLARVELIEAFSTTYGILELGQLSPAEYRGGTAS